ncbi:hypothetical protein [Streptomyces sp. TLI_185]|uniref:hypothetical protein n=1 Tax=Streptomyces sp. TLI_185 TaxID=2485151 RepID=UPI000F92DB92|nr:hypothetical protein [Streptomyces sp. TLI_185]RPF31547.1 hypothetical protein EDD92_1399 [Streptomyces sp. TLI_185]
MEGAFVRGRWSPPTPSTTAGFWHLRAKKRAGIGPAAIGTAPAPVSGSRMQGTGNTYPMDDLDHRFVGVDARETSDLQPETAHLPLSLADHSR